VSTDSFTAPIDFAVFIIRRDSDVSAAARQLRSQIDSGTLTLLDIEVLALGEDGRATREPLEALTHSDPGALGDLQSSESDLLDEEDLADLADELGPDELAVVLVYEDRSLATAAAHLAAEGGRLLWAGGVHTDELEHALEQTKEA